jgi:tRNA pseudouridine38-40 synthase
VNVKLVLEYDGTAFAGWQLQPLRRTVEGELRWALAQLPLQVERLYVAGRTDAGAHAEGQVVNVHGSGSLPPERWAAALNAHLPPDVSVLQSELVSDLFHARYSARWRRYRYSYLDRPARPALGRAHCWHLERHLDVEAMREAAKSLVGRHDWTTFCSASEPEQDRVREIKEVVVIRGRCHVEVEFLGEGFLRGMVRGIAGALAEVGLHLRSPGWVSEIVQARDRSLAAKTAPARGLVLVEVLYE